MIRIFDVSASIMHTFGRNLFKNKKQVSGHLKIFHFFPCMSRSIFVLKKLCRKIFELIIFFADLMNNFLTCKKSFLLAKKFEMSQAERLENYK